MALNPTSTNTQSGNILVYILGAIILIGLLTIMVKGSSTPGSGIDREALEIRVAEVQQYGNELERAVAYVLRNGYSETDIRFAHPNHDSTYGDITDDPARQIFAREGGGATWRDNETDIQAIDTDWVFNGDNRIINPAGGVGTLNAYELIAFLPNVKQDFCLALNKKANVDNPSNNPPDAETPFNITSVFSGVFATAAGNFLDSDLTGVPPLEACYEGSGTPPAGTYHYYRVLLAR
jgi:hypothetical protein